MEDAWVRTVLCAEGNLVDNPTADRENRRAVPATLTTSVTIAYASHLVLFHRVTEDSIAVLRAAFPRRFSAATDRATGASSQAFADTILQQCVAAGYLESAPSVGPAAADAYVVPNVLRGALTHELQRYGSGGDVDPSASDLLAADDGLREFRLPLRQVLGGLAADTLEGEGLIGELAVQHRLLGEWPELERLWYRYGMRIMVTDPVAVVSAFGNLPEQVRDDFRGLWLAHVYSESISVLQQLRPVPAGEDANMLVERLSVQVTEYTAQLGGGWRDLTSADARLHMGVNWMRFQRLRGDFAGALVTLAELQQVMQADAELTTAASDRNHAFCKLEQGILMFFLNRWSEAWEALREAMLLWQRPGYGDYVPAFARVLMAVIYVLRGGRSRAVECLEQAQRIFGEVWDFNYFRVVAESVAALLALDRLDVDHARDRLDSIGESARESEWWPLVLLTRHWVEVLSGGSADSSAPGSLGSPLTGASRLSPFARGMQSRVRVESLLSRAQAQRARAVLVESPVHAAQLTVPLPDCWARLLLMGGRPDQALRYVDIVVHDAGSTARERASARLLAATAHLASGDAAAVQHACAAAVDELRRAASFLPLALMPPESRPLLVQACARNAGWDELLASLELSHTELTARLARIPGGFPATALLVDLTPRERELLQLLSLPIPQSEIAASVHVTLSTIKKQAASLYRKLGVSCQQDALDRAASLGLLDPARSLSLIGAHKVLDAHV